MTDRKSNVDMTRVPDLHHAEQTGPQRLARPIDPDRLPPRNAACPAGESIQTWLGHTQAGRSREAWEEIIRNNPMLAVHGRACYYPCEAACNRKEVDDAVNIHSVERFLGRPGPGFRLKDMGRRRRA